MLTIAAAARTHTGRVRKANEDSVLVTGRFVAVADGLGGHAAGEVASRIAVERLGALDERRPAYPEDVLAAIVDANAEILQATRRDPACEGMGTTVTGLGLVDVDGVEHCVVFNVGDSRVYRFAEQTLAQLTVDHSEVEELLAAGAISPQDAAHYPRRNVVTRCLGSLPSPTPDLWVFRPGGDERYLCCSDGLTNEVDARGIAEILREHRDPDAAADALVEAALSAGGRDNITVIVVDLGTGGGAMTGAGHDRRVDTAVDVTTAIHVDTAPRADPDRA